LAFAEACIALLDWLPQRALLGLGRPSVEAIAAEVEVAVAFMLRAAAHSPARADEPGRRPDAATTADRGVEADTPIPERISGVS
jgi:hypothetical protein